jgi:hypothetical protein
MGERAGHGFLRNLTHPRRMAFDGPSASGPEAALKPQSYQLIRERKHKMKKTPSLHRLGGGVQQEFEHSFRNRNPFGLSKDWIKKVFMARNKVL